MSKSKKPVEANSNQIMGIVAIIVVAIFVVGVIVIFAKSLFPGMDSNVPSGIDTNTKAVTQDVTDDNSVADSVVVPDTSTADSVNDSIDSSIDSSSADSSSSDSDIAGIGTKTVNQYAYLREQPTAEGAEIICMSPNLVVTVLEEADENGYLKVTFLNTTGQLTGYCHQDYLS